MADAAQDPASAGETSLPGRESHFDSQLPLDYTPAEEHVAYDSNVTLLKQVSAAWQPTVRSDVHLTPQKTVDRTYMGSQAGSAVLSAVLQAWQNEKCAPDILHYASDLIPTIVEQIRAQASAQLTGTSLRHVGEACARPLH